MLNTKEILMFISKSLINSYSREKIASFFNDDFNEKQLYNLSKQHNIEGIVGYYLTLYNIVCQEEYQKIFAREYYTQISLSENQNENFLSLCNSLYKNNIPFVPFKGYVIRDLYPIKELRSFGDIDILIHKSDREKSDLLLKKLSYTPFVDYGTVYSYKKGIEYYEIHTSLIDSNNIINNKLLTQYLNTAWNHVINNENYIIFEPEFEFIYLLAHLAKHILYGGCGLRMFIDLALYIKNILDEQLIVEILSTCEGLNFDNFAKSIIYTTCIWFNIKIPDTLKDFNQIDETTLNVFLDYVIDNGIFGKSKSSSGKDIVQNLSQNGNKHPKFTALSNLFIPSLSQMKIKYTYLSKYPILLPFAWCQRGLENIKLLPKRKQKIKDIIKVDNEYINNQTSLFKKIGL